MKRFFVSLIALAATALVAHAALDTYDSVTVKTLGSPTYVALDTTVTNTAVDVAGAKGVGNLIIVCSAAETNDVADYVMTVTLEQSANGTTGFYTVTNGAGSACVYTCILSNGVGNVTSSKLEAGSIKRYLRLKGAAAGNGGQFGGLYLDSK